MTLKDLGVGKTGIINTVGGEGALRQHFLDMGVIPGSFVTVTKLAPMGDPIQVTIHGYELTLRLHDADMIHITEATEEEAEERAKTYLRPEDNPKNKAPHRHEKHPGLGEAGIYHDRKSETPLPEGTVLTFALAGNQNSGKTTLFNQLTGANQHVGNFPGVTVDRKDGVIRGQKNTVVTDLPGIYSLSPYSAEEIVTREFILNEKPKGIINIVDATNIERNLLLTMQLIELDVPMVVALNMMDEVRENGGTININALEKSLGVPVVPISAAKNEGIDELIHHLMHVAYYQEKPERLDFCDESAHGGAVHRAIHSVMELIGDKAAKAGVPIRFAATKLLEGDHLVIEKLTLDEGETEEINSIVKQMEKERGLDRAAAIADMRFAFIKKLTAASVIKPHESKEHMVSRQADRILTGKYTAIPCFVGIMALIFYLTFNLIGPFLQDLLQAGINALAGLVSTVLNAIGVNQVIHSLIVDAIFGGVGSVVSFVPIIVLLFIFLSILEDSGYMARVAFFMDKLLRKIGLSGRSIVPMLLGFGCSVPAVMSTRTLPSSRDRRLTILLIPFMSCSAKILVYGFITAAFFPGHGALIMTLLYFLGIVLGVLTALVLKKTAFTGEAVPFVMELPNYRLPSLKTVLILMWEKTKDFLSKAFSIIFFATLVVWFFQSFDAHFFYVTDAGDSMMADFARLITPVFTPCGFGDWRIVTGLIAGLMAKENVVSTLSMLTGSTPITSLISPLGAVALLVFVLIYTPCVAAMASIRREDGTKNMLLIFAYQMILAWVMAFLVHLIGTAFGLA